MTLYEEIDLLEGILSQLTSSSYNFVFSLAKKVIFCFHASWFIAHPGVGSWIFDIIDLIRSTSKGVSNGFLCSMVSGST